MKHPILFIHIPKTAGTSFRLGVEQSLGREAIIYDYGPTSTETSDLVQSLLYGKEQDFWRFYDACFDAGIKFVGGHFNIRRFTSGFQVANTVTFVRDPLQRMLSEFKHFVRHYGYEGSFEEFYSRPVMQNRLSKILGSVPFESIGIIGLSERYDESLELINDKFGLSIPVREDNRSNVFADNPVFDISKADEKKLKRLNQADLELYRECVELFDTRNKLYQSGAPFSHAFIQQVTNHKVSGWAWWGNGSDEPVEVELLINGEPAQKKIATELRPGLCRFCPPRGAHVGFSFPEVTREGDKVQCRIAETGQFFPSRPVTVIATNKK